MNCVQACLDAAVLRTAGRAPCAGYPVGYPITWPRRTRLACSVGMEAPIGARTISLASRSLSARGVGHRRPEFGGWTKETVGGRRGGRLPVAPTNFLTSLPIASSFTAPTDEVEGGGS